MACDEGMDHGRQHCSGHAPVALHSLGVAAPAVTARVIRFPGKRAARLAAEKTGCRPSCRAPFSAFQRTASVNYFKLHIGDYLRDTAHLSLIEHGTYIRLLHVYYMRESPIPANQVTRLIGAKAKDEIAAVQSVLAEFFTPDGDAWRHKRCDAEIAAYQAKANRNREVGQKGGRPKRTDTESEPRENPNGFQKEPRENPDETLATSHKPLWDSEDLRSSGVPPSVPEGQEPPDDPPPDPRKALWDLGVSLLGARGRSVIGQAIKRVGEQKVATVLGGMAAKPPADPVPYFIGATQERGLVL